MVGNNPNFSKIDVLRCFLRLEQNLSRQKLSKELSLGEGTVRSILDILKSKGLLVSDKKGHSLSKKGRTMIDSIKSYMSFPKETKFEEVYPGTAKVGFLLKDVQKLDNIYILRDVAVKNGADGALILKFDSSLHTQAAGYKLDYQKLENEFSPKKGDCLAIAFAKDTKNAEQGAVSIAVELKSELKSFINSI